MAGKINCQRVLLDGLKSRAYMDFPMNRIFLALLALFAGIATQVSPAEARVRGEMEIGSVVAQRSTGRAAASAQTPAVFQAQRVAPLRFIARALPAANAGPVTLTVLVGPDRARE